MTIRRQTARAFLVFAIAALVLSWATATYAQPKKSLVRVKQADGWKIPNPYQSPLYLR